MTPLKLDNYLRTYRRRSGLTQQDVAFLIGSESGTQISRYEKRRRLPTLRTALALQCIYGVPVAELFAGIFQSVDAEMQARTRKLATKLKPKVGIKKQPQAARRLAWVSREQALSQ
jgi:transcriptional regulator with XRE-family HTH domain